jgi:hypothetical protein
MFKNELGLCIVMTMTDSDIMKKKLETIEGMASVQQTAKKMRSIWIMHFYFRFSFYEVFMSYDLFLGIFLARTVGNLWVLQYQNCCGVISLFYGLDRY